MPLLSACGGGSNSPETVPALATNTEITPELILVSTNRALAGQETLLQLGALSPVIMDLDPTVCLNGGLASKAVIDDDDFISTNDIYNATFQDCKLGVLNDVVNGEVQITVLDYRGSSENATTRLRTTHLQIGEITVDARLSVNTDRNDLSYT